MKKYLVFVMVSVFLSMLASLCFAGGPQFKKCDELKGAALGLCKSAVAVGCDTTKSPECDQISLVVEQATGQPAPTWTCPCGISANFIDIIKTSGTDPNTFLCVTLVYSYETGVDRILSI